jgi:gluconokinase
MLSTDPTSRFHAHVTAASPKRPHIAVSGESTDHKEMEHIWLITGPAGCGKTTVAQYLAKELSLPYVEGDDVHLPIGRPLL